MSSLLAYITAKDKNEAEKVGKALLEKHVAACINILPGMQSWYWWEGKLEAATECVLIAKTQIGLEAQVLEVVRAEHSYKVPCVLFLPVASGNPEYLKWLGDQL